MTSSGLNFSLRPAKHVERKMIIELAQRLVAFGPLTQYSYVGFGGVHFRDFLMFHRDLGFNEMLSIEKKVSLEQRLRFNQPYTCATFEIGHSNSVLPKVDWSRRTILWLDYDGRLRSEELIDVKTFATRARSGSLIVVTLNIQSFDEPNKAIEMLEQDITEENVPLDLTKQQLAGWGIGDVYRQVLTNQIQEILSNRNAPLGEEEKLEFRQLLHFRYQDNARMMTFGGIVYENREAAAAEQIVDSGLSFLRTEQDHYFIQAPNLTTREMLHLCSQLPQTAESRLDECGLADSERDAFVEIYRYYPVFVAVEM